MTAIVAIAGILALAGCLATATTLLMIPPPKGS
jgi:hypothetical protein